MATLLRVDPFKTHMIVAKVTQRLRHISSSLTVALLLHAGCCRQADPKQLGTTAVPAKLLPPEWRRYAGMTGKLTWPLDSGSVHHLLATVDREEARKQVGG